MANRLAAVAVGDEGVAGGAAVKFRYLSLGAGVQSGTLAEMIAEGELPPVDVALFADTGDEPDYVYRYVEYLTERLASVGVPLVTVNNGNIIEDTRSISGHFSAIPFFMQDRAGKIGRANRHCTTDYKVVPIEKYIRRWLLERNHAKQSKNGAIRVNKDIEIECWLGLSLDEVYRMKPAKMKWITSIWPLIDRRMSRHDCILWLQRHRLPVPGKSSCRICPFHDDRYFRDMRDNRPEDWQHVCNFDEFLRSGNSRLMATEKGKLYLYRQCVPLREVDLSTPQDHGQLELFDICDSGYCFV